MVDSIDIANPVRTQAILNQYGLHAKKKFGQNFLTDSRILDEIVAAAEVGPDDVVIEIGPGIGALTEQLAKRAKQVLAFEIDPEMVKVLSETLAPYDNIEVLEKDILEVDLKAILAEKFGAGQAVKIVANLPYYITTPILTKLLEAGLDWENIVVMMQKEVAERLAAQPGSKQYGVLTIMVDYFAKAELAIKVPSSSFNPSPKVDSAVVKLTPTKPEIPVEDPNQLFKLVKGCFAHRRKSLWNNLKQICVRNDADKEKVEQVLAELAINPGIRAERLSLKEMTELYQALAKASLL
ncbi:16S rRNA (adenine(1518)-N(6)/adenine(1519)-N(6))-dimethyltransferase RsmA [Eupransor demetentiae]|uniref:Ribosomal RNA small subunit methyltransferase A n=1 Tax=Eupransor demetentiae TaxID=3109584 RepID=A0ABM9N3A0_9LACO|nr:16S rRNA A1518 and A1519 N6-dimethyltransferase RsmA/KsgA/DIM1 (may also have DNA glycosylase/AP lyase activity) (RsmA) [Lactobacillaceae bacterium LMG 33000]